MLAARGQAKDSLSGLKNPTRISDVIASGLDQYDAVFVPGGHGPMIDLLDDPGAGIVLRHFMRLPSRRRCSATARFLFSRR